MGETSIEWSEFSWNPVRGCSRVSKGCEHCYAEGVARRFSGPGQPYEGLVRLDREGKPRAQWNGTVRFVEEHLADPLRWKRPRMVFVNSMSDLFHEAISFETIAAIFGVMAASPRHTFQVLTKRPERAREFFAWCEPDPAERLSELVSVLDDDLGVTVANTINGWSLPRGAVPDGPLDGSRRRWPLPNVWLGVSVEDQRSADERIPHLLACPAAVRWVSYEPALGPVRFDRIRNPGGESTFGPISALRRWTAGGGTSTGIDWIVVGGESGPGASPFDVAWARSTIAQCREAGVPVFVKQLGAVPLWSVAPPPAQWTSRKPNRKGADMSEWPEDLRVREMPAGRTT